MIAKQIVDRAAYELGDETFKTLKQNEYLRILDRIYRTFAIRTRTINKVVGFLTSATVKEYDLYGIDENGVFYGDTFLKFYRVEYNDIKAVERDFDKIKSFSKMLELSEEDRTVEPEMIVFAIDRNGNYLRMIFPFQPAENDEVILYYHEVPKIGTVNSLTFVPEIDIRYHEDLVAGVVAVASSIILRRIALGRLILSDKALEVMIGSNKESRDIFELSMRKIRGNDAQFMDETVPIIGEVSGLTDMDDFWFDQSVQFD